MAVYILPLYCGVRDVIGVLRHKLSRHILEFFIMKSSEFHRLLRKNGWIHIRTRGSHYIYEKDGKSYPIPYQGSKEIGEGLRKKIMKDLGL